MLLRVSLCGYGGVRAMRAFCGIAKNRRNEAGQLSLEGNAELDTQDMWRLGLSGGRDISSTLTGISRATARPA